MRNYFLLMHKNALNFSCHLKCPSNHGFLFFFYLNLKSYFSTLDKMESFEEKKNESFKLKNNRIVLQILYEWMEKN